MVVPVCVVLCVSWSCGCRSHWNGCMNVACCVLWGGSRSTKPCVFPCKVAAAGKVPRVCGGCGCGRLVPSMCFATLVVPVCVVLCVFWSCGCRSHWNGCMNVAWACGCGRLVPSMCFAAIVVPVCVVLCGSWSCGCRSHWNGCMNVACCVLWGGSRSTKPCVFPCKVAAAGGERYLVCAAVAAAVCLVPSMCFATMVVPVCVVLCVSWSCGCRSHWNGCMNVACCMLWGGSRQFSRK